MTHLFLYNQNQTVSGPRSDGQLAVINNYVVAWYNQYYNYSYMVYQLHHKQSACNIQCIYVVVMFAIFVSSNTCQLIHATVQSISLLSFE